MFHEYLKIKKPLIDKHIISFLDKQKKDFSKVNSWGEELLQKLKQFATLGKTIRGSLIFLTAEMFGFSDQKVLLNLASAVELLHSAFLTHDDIMDHDLKRRGIDTIFASYLPVAKKEGLSDSLSFATSMGMCVGDIEFFLALKLINNAHISTKIKEKSLQKVIDETIYVGLAQMADVYWGHQLKMPARTEIEKIYLYKTARYTFSLPLALGAIVAGKNQTIISDVERLGEFLGLIFQIKDDEIGLLSDEKEIGKPVGSDIRENKKTLIRYYLYQLSPLNQKQFLDDCFGNKDISIQDINKIKSMVKDLDILKIVNKKIQILDKEMRAIISSLTGEKKYKELLFDLIHFLKERKR